MHTLDCKIHASPHYVLWLSLQVHNTAPKKESIHLSLSVPPFPPWRIQDLWRCCMRALLLKYWMCLCIDTYHSVQPNAMWTAQLLTGQGQSQNYGYMDVEKVQGEAGRPLCVTGFALAMCDRTSSLYMWGCRHTKQSLEQMHSLPGKCQTHGVFWGSPSVPFERVLQHH